MVLISVICIVKLLLDFRAIGYFVTLILAET